MKRALVLILSAACTATAAYASDMKITAGMTAWTNTWKENVKTEGGPARDFDNGRALMAGPAFGVRFAKDWFFDASYLKALDDYESANWFANGDSMKFERTDADFQTGYMLRDPFNDMGVGFLLAYKTIDAPASYTNQSAHLNDVGYGTWKLKGPGLGVRIEKPLDEWTVLDGDLVYFLLKEEFAFSSGDVTRFDTEGWMLDVAVSRSLINAMSVNIGVKFQRFKGKKNNGDKITDSFSGLSAGIGYAF